jgi:hypothetical protein
MPSQLTLALSAPPIPRKVFAHYMVRRGFRGFNVGIAAAEDDIITARTMGINGFALNFGAWLNSTDGSTYRANAANSGDAKLRIYSFLLNRYEWIRLRRCYLNDDNLRE